MLCEYQYDGNDIVAEIGGNAVGVTYLRSLNIDEPFIREGNADEYYHADALGSILALSDQTGTAQTTYSYEAFGQTTITGASTNPFQYTGRENDGTELYFYRARFISLKLNRFMSEDPIGFFGGDPNLYRHVMNNPIRYRDPFGLDKDRGGFGKGGNTLLGFGEVGGGAVLVGFGVLHGVVGAEIFGGLGAAGSEASFLAVGEIIHGLGAGLGTLGAGATLAGVGGYLIGKGINETVPYLGTGQLGSDIFDIVHGNF